MKKLFIILVIVSFWFNTTLQCSAAGSVVAILVQKQNHQCNYSECKKNFSKKRDLTKHLRIHTGERSHQCTQCEKKFRDKSSLTRHLKIHTDGKPFTCGTYYKKFKSKRGNDEHKKNQHSIIENDHLKEAFPTEENTDLQMFSTNIVLPEDNPFAHIDFPDIPEMSLVQDHNSFVDVDEIFESTQRGDL